jgi:choline-sulfatase
VSFTHPHDPYVARRRHWDLYEGCEHLDPEVGPIPYEDQDAHSKRLMDACDWRAFDVTPDMVRRARRGYFASVSYVDEKIGEVLRVLEDTRQEAVIVLLSDHGDMLGERGMWFKMSFFEGSASVPLMIAGPGVTPGRVDAPVSTLDLCPTLCDLAGVPMDEVAPERTGCRLCPCRGGERGPGADGIRGRGSVAPMVACATGGGSTSAARPTRRCCST